MVKLTKRQKLIYDEVIYYKRANDGCSPSLITLRNLLITKHGITLSDQTINEEIQRMSGLLFRNQYKNLVVVGGKWDLTVPPGVEVIDEKND